MGWVRFAKSREVEGRILAATIRKTPTGKNFVSILCEVDIQPLPITDHAVGIDLGITTFAQCSNGTIIENTKFFRKYEKQLSRWQRFLNRRTKGGSNWHKARLKVSMIHKKITNCRHDFLHKGPHSSFVKTKRLC